MPRTRPQKLATLDIVDDVARRVPGYKGYQDLAQRREDDRRFRNSIAEYLNSEAHRLERIESHQFGEDYTDLLEEVDAGARKLEFLADSIAMPAPKGKLPGDQSVDELSAVDAKIVEEIERLHRVVHELEKAYLHDERFEMNLTELRGITEQIADFIEQRNVALAK
ncbi:MAG TPA: hypothetical protein VFM17_00075 [Candidatus Eisenbacteria bacterium]|nr:hypothetical protein [Candidatus Eisenbacteria bacterium]